MELNKNYDLTGKKTLENTPQYYEIRISKEKKVGIIKKENKDIHFLFYDEIKKGIKDISDRNLIKMGISVFSNMNINIDNSVLADLVLNLFCHKYEVDYISTLRLKKDEITAYVKSLELTSQEQELWQYIRLYLGLN